MRERPILFSAPMVRALRSGIKTQTRRTRGLDKINEAPDAWSYFGPCDSSAAVDSGPPDSHAFRNMGGDMIHVRCPYGVSGDNLWSREHYQLATLLEDIPAGDLANSKDAVRYCADGAVRGEPIDDFGRVRSSRFMPRWASRDTLELVSVRPERLQSITEEDAIAEGLTAWAVREVITPVAARLKKVPQHWVHGGDEGLSYCLECCRKEVKRLLKEHPSGDYIVDGGWDTEGDSQESCELCHRTLDHSFTDYCCESEIEHFEKHGWSLTPSDADSLLNIIGASLWDGGELSASIKRLSYAALWESINDTGSWAKNPWLWRLEFRPAKNP